MKEGWSRFAIAGTGHLSSPNTSGYCTRSEEAVTGLTGFHSGHGVAICAMLSRSTKPQGNAAMPEIVVYAAEGRTVEQKKKLLKAITHAVVDAFEVEPNSVTVSIIETPKHLKAKGGVPFDER